MKFYAYILFSLWAFSSLQAQKLTMSEPERLSNEITHFDILGKVNGNIILYKYGRNYFEVNAFNSKDLELNWSKEIRYKDKRPIMLEMVLTDNGALAFYSIKANGFNNLMVQPLDKRFRLKGDPVLVNESEDRNLIYRINHNVNRKYFAIEIINRQGNSGQDIETVVLTDGLQKVSSIQVRNDKNWKFKQSKVGLNGEVFMISDKKGSGLFAGDAGIQAIKVNKLINGALDEQFFEYNDTIFLDYECDIDLANDKLVIAGAYSINNVDNVSGFFFTKIAYASEQAEIVFTKMPEEIVKQTNRKSFLGYRNRLDELTITKIIPRTDGGVLLLGELYAKVISSVNSGGSFSTDLFNSRAAQTKTYTYDDIVAISISPDGDYDWNEVLRKAQYSEDDDGHFSSFGTMNVKDKLHLIFNENIDYITPVSSFSLTQSGAKSIKTIFNSDKYDLLMSPKFSKQVAKNEIIIPAYTTRNYFVLVQLIY